MREASDIIALSSKNIIPQNRFLTLGALLMRRSWCPPTAPYGSWKSPITSDLIVAQSITLSELCLDGGHVYWLEGRPQEQGRYVVVRPDADGQPTDITPPPYNARTRVHEYGGGSWTVRNGTGSLARNSMFRRSET